MKNGLVYIVEKLQTILEELDGEKIAEIVDSILSANTVFIYGVGRSGLVGKAFAVRLVQMGLKVHFVGDMTTPIVMDGDVVLIVSNTGETMSAVQTANIVRRVGAKVMSITSNPHSKLAHASNLVLEIPVEKDATTGELAPLGTLFEDSAFLFFDSLVPVLMERLGQSEASLRRRHAIWV
ncbi:MAG: 6-phospho-3-hexuloisomerase [Methanomassiliicoccales archaeon]